MTGYVWAVDPGLAVQAVAFADVDTPTVQVRTLITRTTEREGARLGLLDRQLRIAARHADATAITGRWCCSTAPCAQAAA